jgi:hypothetical protein
VIGRNVIAAGLLATLLPSLAAAVCAPAATAIFPAAGIAGTSVTATITGEALDGATLSVFGPAGLTATVQSSAETAVGVRLDLDPGAVPGERLLFLDTPGGTTGVSFTINAAGGLVVDGVTPALFATRGVELDALVTGANLGAITASEIAISGAGVSVLSAAPSADGTMLSLALAVDAAADLGTHAITVTTGAGSVVLTLYVRRPPPSVTAVHPAAGEVGAAVPIAITGTNLGGAALVVTTPGAAEDITITDVATPDDATLTATLAIAPTATASVTEPRLLIVTTESGQTTIEFFVVPAGALAVTGIEPGAGERGATSIPVTLHGLHLTSASVSGGAPDLTLANQNVVDDETLTLEISISGAAAAGDRTLTISGPAGSAPVIFRVLAPGDPFIGSVRPPFGNRGSTIVVFLKGVNLGLIVPGSGVSMNPGSGLQLSNAAAVDDGLVRVTVDIDAQANIGQRDVKVTLSNAKTYTKSQSWRANNPGHVPIIDDVSPRLVAPGTTTPMTVTGSDFTGAAVLVTGPGASVANTVVDPGGTLLTFDLTLAADAPAENRAVIVITEAGTARCGIASDPSPPPLLAAKLVKTGALFVVPDAGFRLLVFEFSAGPLFDPGPRTWTIADGDGSLTLSRLDAVDVERAFRELHRGWVRVRAVTATNRIATSPPQSIRR